MSELTSMPNIGKTTVKRLAAVGIYDRETLLQLGSKEAYRSLKLIEGDTCFSTLCGLEGAVEGIRWHFLSADKKAELKQFFDSL
jgi:DNA transformation protein